ncbi:hypothetical protein Zmor_024036 [Zophobas morio]|uniref:Uncharacterized protein n=1 Tax=Zophobas morio TaxID=2755281 RepID=A0AA38M7U2_9CUCU|nr:hypothetical protein Zmor_024036 [Zophobas morio]
MHKLIHSLVLHMNPSTQLCDDSARPRQTSHLRLQPGRIQNARDEDLRAACLPQHFQWQYCDMSWRPVKIGIYSDHLIQYSAMQRFEKILVDSPPLPPQIHHSIIALK